jgi:hypothetical protein
MDTSGLGLLVPSDRGVTRANAPCNLEFQATRFQVAKQPCNRQISAPMRLGLQNNLESTDRGAKLLYVRWFRGEHGTWKASSRYRNLATLQRHHETKVPRWKRKVKDLGRLKSSRQCALVSRHLENQLPWEDLQLWPSRHSGLRFRAATRTQGCEEGRGVARESSGSAMCRRRVGIDSGRTCRYWRTPGVLR